jgi:plastocyanin
MKTTYSFHIIRFTCALVLLPTLALAQTIHTVNQVSLSFSPSDLTINVGDTVQWIRSSGSHTVTNGTGSADPEAGSLFDAPLNATNPTVTYTFTTAGDFDYFCRPHEGFGMTGIVHVLLVPPATINFAGLDHTPLGNATLADSGTGTLTVSNIGSSGLDGVSIDLGETADGFAAIFPLDPAGPPGASFSWQVQGTLDAGLEQTLLTMGAVTTAGGIDLHPDFSPLGSATFTLTIQDNTGSTVHAQSGLSPGDVSVTSSVPVNIKGFALREANTNKVRGGYAAIGGWLDISVAGAGVFLGTTVVFEPDSHPVQTVQPTVLDWFFSQLPTFDILGEALTVFGNDHTAIGQAQLQATGGTLTVSNIGSSGTDGVQQDLPPDTVEDCIIWDIQDGGGGSSVQVDVIGTSGGTASPAGSILYTDIGSTYQVTADFSPLGSSTTTVQVWNGSAMVVEFTGQIGVLAETTQISGNLDIIILVFSAPSFNTVGSNDKYDTVQPIIVGPLAETHMGDRLVLIPENTDSAVDNLQSIVVLCSQIPEFTIVNELINSSVAAVETPGVTGLLLLDAPHPNPFNPKSAISFELVRSGSVDLDVLDARGRRIKYLLAGDYREAARYTVYWDGTDAHGAAVASGTYLFRLRSGGQHQVVKGMLVR